MKITILTLAKNDLKEIYKYLSAFGQSPPEKFRKSFESFCLNAVEMPHMFSRYKHNQSYYKAIIAYDYLVFYQLDEGKGIIKIYRVLHSKRNIEPLLD